MEELFRGTKLSFCFARPFFIAFAGGEEPVKPLGAQEMCRLGVLKSKNTFQIKISE